VFDAESLRSALEWVQAWLFANLLTLNTLAQLAAILLSFAMAFLLGRPVSKVLERIFADERVSGVIERLGRFRAVLFSIVRPILWSVLLGAMASLGRGIEQPVELLRITSTLVAAWIVIRVTSSLIAEPFWARTAALVAWSIAALNVLHLLTPALEFLDGLGFTLGCTNISALSILKGTGLAAVLLWGAFSLSTVFQRRIEQLPSLTPSVQVLISQTLKVALITLAVVVALGSVGIDLTAFTVFSGAVGVGVGFGLQKIVSNLISGIILLLDRSIKPGDVIEVGGTYGRVDSLGARYASIVTRDGTEYLVPNEDLITQPVANWSYSSSLIRRKVPIGISYDSDLDLATELILECAREVERVVDEPGPKCHLVGFGDSSVDLELRYWLTDPENGVSNVRDKVLRKVWKRFHEHGIQIPYPQRDLHIRTPGALRFETDRPNVAASDDKANGNDGQPRSLE